MNTVLEEMLAVLIVVAAILSGWAGHHFTAQHYELKLAAARQAQTAAVDAKEHEMQDKLDAMAAQHIKDQQDAQAKYDALAATYRNGSRSVRVAVAHCEPADTHSGAVDQKAVAELLPETSASLVDLARDADDTVSDLNACVDRYNAIKAALDPAPATP